MFVEKLEIRGKRLFQKATHHFTLARSASSNQKGLNEKLIKTFRERLQNKPQKVSDEGICHKNDGESRQNDRKDSVEPTNCVDADSTFVL